MNINELLAYTKQQGASDLHLSVGSPPILRRIGTLRKVQGPPLDRDTLRQTIDSILTAEQRKRYDEQLELDFSYTVEGVARFRVNVFCEANGPAAAFRLVPTEIPTLVKLGLPPVFGDLALREKGLILVTGPTGSGKSTTMAAMLDHINERKSAHIITIEDPIEFVHPPKKCLVHQRELGEHTRSIAAALRSSLREDPDVIMVGEMRDLETTSLTITAAETGHLVLATLHTNSVSKTVDRIIDIFPTDAREQVRMLLSESILAVIAQTLVPRRDGSGRVAAFEILLATVAIRNLIREGKTFQIPSVLQTSQAQGMLTLDAHLRDLVNKGLINSAEAAKKANDPSLFIEVEKPTRAIR